MQGPAEMRRALDFVAVAPAIGFAAVAAAGSSVDLVV